MKIKHYLGLCTLGTSIGLASFGVISEAKSRYKEKIKKTIRQEYISDSEKYLNVIKNRLSKIEEIEDFKNNISFLIIKNEEGSKIDEEEKNEIVKKIFTFFQKNKNDSEVIFIMGVYYLKYENNFFESYSLFKKYKDAENNGIYTERVDGFIHEIVLDLKETENFKDSLKKFEPVIRILGKYIIRQIEEEIEDKNNSQNIRERFIFARKLINSDH